MGLIMELNIVQHIKELRRLLKTTYTQNQKLKLKLKQKLTTVTKVSKPETKHKLKGIVVQINGREMTLKEIAEQYHLNIKTVQARYKVGNRGKLLTRPSNRVQQEQATQGSAV